MNQYQITKIIKNGQNKISIKVKDRIIDKYYFLKIKLKNSLNNDESCIYKLLVDNKNPNIENIISVYENKCLYFIVSEYIETMLDYNLEELLSLGYNFKIDEIKVIIYGTLNGLSFLHKNRILHGDLKLQNIMYNMNSKIVKIIDFDMAKIIKEEYMQDNKITGTENYIPPETYDLKLYSLKSDIWSLGMCFYRLITNKFPYKNDYSKLSNFYIKNSFKDLDLDYLDKFKSEYDDIVLVVKNMLDFDDQKRMDCDTIIKKLKDYK